jgi:hypothetical protein
MFVFHEVAHPHRAHGKKGGDITGFGEGLLPEAGQHVVG